MEYGKTDPGRAPQCFTLCSGYSSHAVSSVGISNFRLLLGSRFVPDYQIKCLAYAKLGKSCFINAFRFEAPASSHDFN